VAGDGEADALTDGEETNCADVTSSTFNGGPSFEPEQASLVRETRGIAVPSTFAVIIQRVELAGPAGTLRT
jgi:hypothetical protein